MCLFVHVTNTIRVCSQLTHAHRTSHRHNKRQPSWNHWSFKMHHCAFSIFIICTAFYLCTSNHHHCNRSLFTVAKQTLIIIIWERSHSSYEKANITCLFFEQKQLCYWTLFTKVATPFVNKAIYYYSFLSYIFFYFIRKRFFFSQVFPCYQSLLGTRVIKLGVRVYSNSAITFHIIEFLESANTNFTC